MNLGQMMLVLICIVFFSIQIINVYSYLGTQQKILNNSTFILQAQKLADSIFEKTEAEILGKYYQFSFIDSMSNSGHDSLYTDINGVDFYVNMETNFCDLTGNIDNPDSNFIRMDLRMKCIPENSDTLFVGTDSHPIKKVFKFMGLN